MVPGATDTGAAYELTEAEQREATNVLIELLFTVVETPHARGSAAGERGAFGS